MKKRFTKNREHWAQSMTDIRIRPNLNGLNEKEKKIAEKIWDYVPQYRAWAKRLAINPTLQRANLDYTCSVFYWNGEELEIIADNVTKHRGAIITGAIEDWKNGKINADIWANYCTNGHTTRIGLYRANNQQHRIEKAKRMAKSHADYIGNETGDALTDHRNRVATRN